MRWTPSNHPRMIPSARELTTVFAPMDARAVHAAPIQPTKPSTLHKPQSITGLIVRSSWEILRPSGTTVICLSLVRPIRFLLSAPAMAHTPHRSSATFCAVRAMYAHVLAHPRARPQWGDSSPLLPPCIRFGDLAVHTMIIAATVRHLPPPLDSMDVLTTSTFLFDYSPTSSVRPRPGGI